MVAALIVEGDALHVAAYSRREAATIIAESEKGFRKLNYEVTNREIGQWDRELQTYFSDCWGKAMDGITPEKGVWYTDRWDSKPKRIWP